VLELLLNLALPNDQVVSLISTRIQLVGLDSCLDTSGN